MFSGFSLNWRLLLTMKAYKISLIFFTLFFLKWTAPQWPPVEINCPPFTKNVKKCISSNCDCASCRKKYRGQHCVDISNVPGFNLTKYNCTRNPSCSTTRNSNDDYSAFWVIASVLIIVGIIVVIIVLISLCERIYKKCCCHKRYDYAELQ